MSHESKEAIGPQQDGAGLQRQLDAALRELATTQAMLCLTELRLNAALGMPDEQLARCVHGLDTPGTLIERTKS